MRVSTLISGLSAISGLALAQATIESEDFSVVSALEDLGIDVTEIPALETFSGLETRSTDKACAAAVSANLGSFCINPKLAGSCAIANSNTTIVRKLELPLRLQSL
jgi:hypothetical protein